MASSRVRKFLWVRTACHVSEIEAYMTEGTRWRYFVMNHIHFRDEKSLMMARYIFANPPMLRTAHVQWKHHPAVDSRWLDRAFR